MGENRELRHNGEKSRYELLIDGNLAGYATYTDRDGARVFEHTVVNDAYRGQGLSKPLIRFALDSARSEGLGIVPECSAVVRFVEENPEYQTG